MCRTLARALLAATLAPYVAAQDDAPESYQLRVIEEFYAVGDEPVFWAAHVLADFERAPLAADQVRFGFELTRFDALVGDEVPIPFIVREGRDRMNVLQNPLDQSIRLQGEATIEGWVNQSLETLAEVERSGSWSESIALLDGELVPGATAAVADTQFDVQPLPLGRFVFWLVEYKSAPVRFQVGESVVEVAFDGVFLTDADRSLVYHAAFQQSGTVTSGEAVTNLSHVVALALLDRGDQPLVPLEGRVLDAIDAHRFPPRPEGELDPEITEGTPRPPWAVGLWLAGRMAGTTLSMVAEQGTNPMPVLSLASLVLTDQSLGYAGNLWLDWQDIQAGRKSEEGGLVPYDHEYRSPLEQLYSSPDAAPTRFAERLTLLGPATTGASEIEDQVYPVGVPLDVARRMWKEADPSPLKKLLAEGLSAGDALAVVSAGGGGLLGLSWTTIGIIGGGIAVGGGVAVALEEDDGAGPDVVLTFTENESLPGCFVGNVTVEAEGLDGATLEIRTTGDYADISGQPQVWEVMASAPVNDGRAQLNIAVPEHCPCIDGSITILLDGQGIGFVGNGQSFPSGTATNDCF